MICSPIQFRTGLARGVAALDTQGPARGVQGGASVVHFSAEAPGSGVDLARLAARRLGETLDLATLAVPRRPGDLHVYFVGIATRSFGEGIATRPGAIFEITAAAFALPLRNPLASAAIESAPIWITTL